MKGILVVNKPKGYTSRDIVNVLGKTVGTKKVGHTGTLDPLATGVLVVLLGRYTKLADIIVHDDKEYIAEIKLGVRTDTLDITGNILEKRKCQVSKEEVLKIFKSFIGNYKMEVPIYSAVKVKGKKLYEYARRGIDVELPIKEVEIRELELINLSEDTIKMRCVVSKGTYIRSLIRDICKDLNVIGTMQSLERTRQGKFRIEDCYTIDDVRSGNFKLKNIDEALDLPSYHLNDSEYGKVRNGSKINLAYSDKFVLLLFKREEIAIYEKDDDSYKVYVMLKID